MKRTVLVAVVAGLLLSACASSQKPSAKTHYSVVPETQVTLREKKPQKHSTYTVQPGEEYVSGSAGH